MARSIWSEHQGRGVGTDHGMAATGAQKTRAGFLARRLGRRVGRAGSRAQEDATASCTPRGSRQGNRSSCRTS